MPYSSPVPCDAPFIFSIGQALYSFAALEWNLMCVGRCIHPTFVQEVEHLTAWKVHRRFAEILGHQSTLSSDLEQRLRSMATEFGQLTTVRNDLVHAHAYTVDGGPEDRFQRLVKIRRDGSRKYWSIPDVDEACRQFDELSLRFNRVLHNELSSESGR